MVDNMRSIATEHNVEKDIFLCAERSLQTSYDDFFLQAQHNVDNIIYKNINEGLLANTFYELNYSTPYLSMYSSNIFFASTNLFNPKEFIFLDEEVKFNSIYQFLCFHKAILFLDRKSAKEILKADNVDDLLDLNEGIKRIDKFVWAKYRILIVQHALEILFKNNSVFKSHLLESEDKVILFIDSDVFFGCITKECSHPKTITKNNYYGKLLTTLKLNNI